MEGRKLCDSTHPKQSATRRRDTIIDELPPEETEKLGYVWIVNGTPLEEDEFKASQCPTSMSELSVHSDSFNRSYCTTGKENFHELIRPSDGNTKEHERHRDQQGLGLSELLNEAPSFLTPPPGDLGEATLRYLKDPGRERAKEVHRRKRDPPATSKYPTASLQNIPSTHKALPSTQDRDANDHSFLKEYILKKVEQLENRLKSVEVKMNDSKERQGRLQQHLIELEILKLVEHISSVEMPSEEEVARLEYLTEQLKTSKGIKEDFVDHDD